MKLSNCFTLRVYIEDTDYAGVVYHANYLKYFERARSEWAEQLGVGMEWQQEQKIYFPVRYANVEYLRPARVHQILEVVSEIREIRKASIIYYQQVQEQSVPDVVLCKAEVKIACVGWDLKPQTLPELPFKL